MAEVTTPADALEFLRRKMKNATNDDRRELAGIADTFASSFLCPKIDRLSNEAIREEFSARGLGAGMGNDVDEALAAIRRGDHQRATYLLERNASWAGKCTASAAWTNAGRPECGRLL